MRDGVLRASGPPQSVLTAEHVADVFHVQLHQWEEAGLERPLLAMAPRQGKAVS
jgi:ABC-type cobalamin/Fe3+-siderophores transport system ATPase subunit